MHVCVFKRDFDISNVYKYGRNPIAFNGLVEPTCSHRPRGALDVPIRLNGMKTGRRREKTDRVFELLVRMKPFFSFVTVGEAEWPDRPTQNRYFRNEIYRADETDRRGLLTTRSCT